MTAASSGSYPSPTPAEMQRWLTTYFRGHPSSDLRLCVDAGYLDMCRTLRGISKTGRAGTLRCSASELLLQEICRIACSELSQAAYDNWHRELCDGLVATYNPGFPSFSDGQAQKWLNMAMKYAVLSGDSCVRGIGAVLPYAHVPVDKILLHELAKRGLPGPGRYYPWSRIKSYDLYMELQRWVRTQFAPSVPCAVEFRLWAPTPAIGRQARGTCGAALIGSAPPFQPTANGSLAAK